MLDIIVLWDWDGTLVNTMPVHADLAAECIREVFGVDYSYARKKYLETTGIPFDSQLEKIFPRGDQSAIDYCAKIYHVRKIIRVYENPEDFPETLETLNELHNLGYRQFISSSTEEEIIKSWAEKRKIECLFEGILGRESGNKKNHIAKVKGTVVFVSDSVGDMSLPAICLGVCVPTDKEEEFKRSQCFKFTNDPINNKWIVEALQEIESK
jgi:phosphoglycolate phosphatase-like HAD superfamily hydrolase